MKLIILYLVSCLSMIWAADQCGNQNNPSSFQTMFERMATYNFPSGKMNSTCVGSVCPALADATYCPLNADKTALNPAAVDQSLSAIINCWSTHSQICSIDIDPFNLPGMGILLPVGIFNYTLCITSKSVTGSGLAKSKFTITNKQTNPPSITFNVANPALKYTGVLQLAVTSGLTPTISSNITMTFTISYNFTIVVTFNNGVPTYNLTSKSFIPVTLTGNFPAPPGGGASPITGPMQNGLSSSTVIDEQLGNMIGSFLTSAYQVMISKCP